MRLIDADTLHEEANQIMWNLCSDSIPRWSIHAMIENSNTVDAVTVVHGHWVDYLDTFSYGFANCSIYGWQMDVRANRGYHRFCPNCGARMDSEQDDD